MELEQIQGLYPVELLANGNEDLEAAEDRLEPFVDLDRMKPPRAITSFVRQEAARRCRMLAGCLFGFSSEHCVYAGCVRPKLSVRQLRDHLQFRTYVRAFGVVRGYLAEARDRTERPEHLILQERGPGLRESHVDHEVGTGPGDCARHRFIGVLQVDY